jgi:hypothetical protein
LAGLGTGLSDSASGAAQLLLTTLRLAALLLITLLLVAPLLSCVAIWLLLGIAASLGRFLLTALVE